METSTIEKNKAVIRSLYDQALNNRKPELLKQVIADEYTGARGIKGPAGFLEPISALWTSFPDINWKIEELVAEGEKVAARWKWTGTHTAQYANFPATNKVVTSDGLAIFELKNGKVIRIDLQNDRLGFLQQMGAVPKDVIKPN